jgi:hypothetical protein
LSSPLCAFDDPRFAFFLFPVCGREYADDPAVFGILYIMYSLPGYCAAQRIQLNLVSITATPTGTATTGDPLSMFEAPTPTSGATVAVTMELPPLIPSYSVQNPGQAQPKTGSAVGLNAFRALDMSIVVAAGAVIVLLGVSSF